MLCDARTRGRRDERSLGRGSRLAGWPWSRHFAGSQTKLGANLTEVGRN